MMTHMNHRSDDLPDRPQASTDHAVLTDAYTDGQPLTARQRLYDHQTPRYDLPGMALEQIGDRAGMWLDAGCGNGYHLHRIRAQRPDVRVIGLDLSTDLLAELGGAVLRADAAHLPLRTGSVQVVLMMHMLYHVTEPDRALTEAARVLEPEGVLIASTNSRTDKTELDNWWAQAAADVLGNPTGPKRVKLSDHFPAETAATAVAAHFNKVTMIDLAGVIEVDAPAPILAHYASYRAWAHQTDVPFEATLEQVGHLLRAKLEDGPLRINTRQVMVVGSHPLEHGSPTKGPTPS